MEGAEKIILKVYLDAAAQRVTEVPITPHTTVGDVLDCCREPDDEVCHLAELWRGIERPVLTEERPYEILQQWGIHRDEVRFYLRYEPTAPRVDDEDGVRTCRQPARNGMTGSRTSDNTRLPHGVDLTLAELQEMAARQQQQIEAQQQLLVAKEQRLRFLKQQELRHEQIAAENERLRKLREKVEAQELKLKKLRALRGQVSDHKGNNNNLTAELEMIKSLFNEKEKELSLAVTKVEELTKQLEELRNGHVNGQHADNRNNSPAFLELDKLRKELMVRNKLNEAQNSKLAAHREVMQQRKEEMSTMDMRIAELQQRLRKNRNLQQQQRKEQLAQQGTVGPRGGSLNAKIGTSRPLSANVAAVEPYIKHGTNKDAVIEHQQGYGISKHDPKYQTLPPNIKLLGLDGKKTLDSEPNGNGAATTGGAVEQMDNGHVEKNNNIPAGDSHVDVCTQGDGSNGQGRGSPGKGANDLLPKETVHKVPEFKPSKGHTTAFAVMEEVLKKSGVDGSRSGVVAGGAVSVPPRNVYGPTAYRPPGNLSNFTARPFGSTYSTAMLANRPSIISTEPSQALPNTASGVSVSSPGALFPKTSTPISGVPSNNNNEEMREIFITDAPMSSSMSFAGRLSAYTAASSTSGGGAEILPPQPKYPPLSVSTTDGQHTGGAVMSEVSPRQGDVTRPPQYQIASSRPQQPMHPQRVSDAPSPQLDMSTTQTLPSSQPRQSSSTSSIAATGNKTTSTSSTTSSFMGRATGSSMSEGRPAVPGQISLSMSTKVTLSEHHALDSNTDSVRSTSGSVSQAGQPENNTGYAGSSTTPTPGNVSQQQPADVGSRSEKPILPAERDSKKDITANSVSSALSILMSGPSTTAPATRPFRYAPKSVIANTYMRKLGSNTLDEYRKSMNQIYKDFALTPASTVPSGPERKEPGSPVKTDQPCSAFRGGEPDMAEGPRSSSRASLGDVPPRPQSPPESGMENPPPSPTRSGLPPYPRQTPYEMEAERIRYKANAPKTLRRRLSSGESDDLAHFLPKPQHASPTDTKESSPCTAGSSSRASQQNIVRVDTIQDSYNNNFGSDIHDSQAAMTIYDTPHGDGEQLSPVEVISTPTTKDDNKLSVVCRKKTNLKTKGSIRSVRRVSFDPLALLLDASLEGELELVKRTAREVSDPSAANDEGITALHNAICANHYDIVRFLTEFGCNVNAPDSDGWTPLHCAASCNNLAMVKLLVEHGACIFATTISDHETAAEKCEEDEDGYDGCSEYLYSVQEKLGIVNKGTVYAVFDYSAANPDELGFKDGNSITVLRKGDEQEKDWWWARRGDREGYIPRNLLGSYPRVPLQSQNDER